MKRFQVAVLVGLIGGGSTACVTEVEPDNPQTQPRGAASQPGEAEAASQPSEADAVPKQRRRAKRHHRGGFEPAAMLVNMAIDELTLDVDQVGALEDALDDLEADTGLGAGHLSLNQELARGLRAGKLDETRIEEKFEAIRRATTAHHANASSAMDTLYTTLTADQRKTLIEIARARGEAMRARFAAMAKKHAGKKPDEKASKAPMHAMWLLHGLDVSMEQREALKTALADAGFDKPEPNRAKEAWEAMRKQGEAIYDAFLTADFSASQHYQAPAAAKMGQRGMEGHVATMKALTTILSAEQRASLAERLERGPRPPGPPPQAD